MKIPQPSLRAPGGASKCTDVNPDSVEGQAILKSHFISQSSSDIRGKLQKWELRPPHAHILAGGVSILGV